MSASVASWEKRWPGCQLPVVVFECRLVSLVPRPEEWEVQKGMTVLFVKSVCLTKESTGQAERPHQIG